jgi:hypothetical protein
MSTPYSTTTCKAQMAKNQNSVTDKQRQGLRGTGWAAPLALLIFAKYLMDSLAESSTTRGFRKQFPPLNTHTLSFPEPTLNALGLIWPERVPCWGSVALWFAVGEIRSGHSEFVYPGHCDSLQAGKVARPVECRQRTALIGYFGIAIPSWRRRWDTKRVLRRLLRSVAPIS